MSTIVELIERIEADRRAMLDNPNVQGIVAQIEEAARQQQELMERLEVPPMAARIAKNLEDLRSSLQEQVENRERIERFMKSLVATPPPVVEPHYYVHPDIFRIPRNPHITPTARRVEPEPLPERTIVRRELTRKIGFSKEGFRPKD